MNRLFKTVVVGVTFVFGGMAVAPDLNGAAQAQVAPTKITKKAPKKITRPPAKKSVSKITKAPNKKSARKKLTAAQRRAAKKAVRKASAANRVDCQVVSGGVTDCRPIAVKKTVRKIVKKAPSKVVKKAVGKAANKVVKKAVRKAPTKVIKKVSSAGRVECTIVNGAPTDCRPIAAKKVIRKIDRKASAKSTKKVIPKVLPKAPPRKS